jgi:hypothetical protein
MVSSISGTHNLNNSNYETNYSFTQLLANLSNNTQAVSLASSQYNLSMPLNASSPAAISAISNAVKTVFDALNELIPMTSGDPNMSNILNNTSYLCTTFLTALNSNKAGTTMTSPPLNFVIEALNTCCSYGASYNGNKSVPNANITPIPIPTPPPTLKQLCDTAWRNMNPPNYVNCDTPLAPNFSSAILTLMQQSLTLSSSDFSSFLTNNFQSYPGPYPTSANAFPVTTWDHSFLGALIANYSLYSPNPSNISTTDLENINSLLLYGLATGPNGTNTGYGGFPGTSTTKIPLLPPSSTSP